MDLCYLADYTSEKRLAEEQAEFWLNERDKRNGRPEPEAARKSHCFRCRADVDWKPRVPYDWRLSPETTYEPGTDTKHFCKRKTKIMDYREEQWRQRQKETARTTLKVGGKNVDL